MSTLTVIIPGSQAVLDIADNTLVYDGMAFVEPSAAKYVELYAMPVEALTLPFVHPSETIEVSVLYKAQVLNYNAASQPVTDPQVVHAGDPSMGQCICGITCLGTNLAYVKVYNEVTP